MVAAIITANAESKIVTWMPATTRGMSERPS